jgi:hypothetical protein
MVEMTVFLEFFESYEMQLFMDLNINIYVK